MKEENDHLTPEDELRLQNEIKKVNLEINHGAVDFFSSNELPPELKGAAEVERQEGLGICQLQFEDKEWRLQGVQIPGFVF